MEYNSRCIGLSFDVDNVMFFIFNINFPCLSDYNDELEIEVRECLIKFY